jgi:hypothetical protein
LRCARAKRTESTDYLLGTVDQIAAGRSGRHTIPSLELGTDINAQLAIATTATPVHQNSLLSPTTPLPAQNNPRAVFERLFGDGGTSEQRRSELKKNASILDWVMKDMTGMRTKLGAGDQTKLNEYLDAVREVERRIQRAERQSGESVIPDLQRPASVPDDWEAHVKLMFDLQVLALRTDLTDHHVPAGTRKQHANLSADRRSRAAPPGVTSHQRSGKARQARQD